jgi:hypothetical protein
MLLSSSMSDNSRMWRRGRWRSWNAFGNRIDQGMMTAAMDALTSRNRTIMGRSGVSLCGAAGYCSVGVDEGWEACGAGVNGTQHDAHGRPTINITKFPDMKAMVSYGHSLDLQVGWYLNGCACPEKIDEPRNYHGDVSLLHYYGFDGVKMCARHKLAWPPFL